MNNQQAIDRLVKHLEWGWTEETVEAIEMGIHALKETQWIPCSEKMPEDNTDVIVCFYSGTVTEITNKKTVTVSGKTDDVSSKPVTVTVNGATVTVGTDGTFTKDVTLAEGANTITIVAKDKAGKTTTVTRKVTVDTSAPVIKSVTLTPNPVDCGKTFIIAVEITD